MNTVDTVERAKQMLALSDVEMPTKKIATYQNCLAAQIFTINQVNLMKRMLGEVDVTVDVYHSATFEDLHTSEQFVAMLTAHDYWVEAESVIGPDEFKVDFLHPAPKLDQFFISMKVSWIVKLVEGLYGKYGNWDIQLDPSTKKPIPSPITHQRSITGIHWHSYDETTLGSCDEVAELFERNVEYSYRVDDQTGIRYSFLRPSDLLYIMDKLNSGKGRISMHRLHHFDDNHLKVVSEILEKKMYTDYPGKYSFADVALSQLRMGRKRLAMEFGVHSLALGEDLLKTAKFQDNEIGSHVEFAQRCIKESLYRQLNSGLPQKSTAKSRKPKL